MMYLTATKHYLKRALSVPIEIALMTLLPIGIIVINIVMNLQIVEDAGGETIYGNYDVMATAITFFIVLMFQVMSGAYSGEYVFEDLRNTNRWRLKAAPVSPSVFVFGAIVASLIFSFLSAALVLAVGYIFFSVYLGNILTIVPVIILLSLIGQFMGIIVALFVSKKGAINGIIIVLSFVMSALAGQFMVNIPIPSFIRDHLLPTGVAFRAITTSSVTPLQPSGASDSLFYIAILAVMAVILGIATLIIARRRPV